MSALWQLTHTILPFLRQELKEIGFHGTCLVGRQVGAVIVRQNTFGM